MATTRISPDMIHGTVAPGFEAVKAAFYENFAKRKELGAACAAYYQGQKVVDLWGGIRDHRVGLPWEEDTMVLVFSTTKGMASMCMALAHSRDMLNFEKPVAEYWPEFAQNGKENITVRQLISHKAGLCAIDEPLNFEQLADPDVVAAAIAKQKPLWEPGDAHGYHGLTLGWYEGELIRRVDPKHRTIGQFFQDEIATPLGLEFFIGLPKDMPASRVAHIKGYPRWKMLFNLDKMPRNFVKGMFNPRSITARTFSNPKVLGVIPNYNKREMQEIELPAANGIGEVRSIAKAYGSFAMGGKELGITEATMKELMEPASTPPQGLMDLVLRMPTTFSLGYCKPSSAMQFGSSNKAFGTPGAGGSFGFADPGEGIGFAYAMNKSGFYLIDDPREKALRDAVYESVKQLKKQKV